MGGFGIVDQGLRPSASFLRSAALAAVMYVVDARVMEVTHVQQPIKAKTKKFKQPSV